MINAIAEAAAIREATLEDVPALARMFQQFLETEAYRAYVPHNAEAAEKFLREMITLPDRVVFVRTVPDVGVVGMLGLMAYHHPMTGRRQAGEMFWWLDPAYRGHGGWLLRRAERWARLRGAETLQMVSPYSNARVQETYVALGYQPLEIAFYKELR